MPRQRDFKAEYARRVARGLRRGFSRAQARGHPKVGESHISPTLQKASFDPRLEQGLKGLRQGKSLTAAARQIRTSPERLRRYVNRAGVVEKRRGRWIASDDNRHRELAFFSRGKVLTITVADFATAALIGRYMAGVSQFLRTNDPGHLEPFAGESVNDVSGQNHPFETRPNVLFRLDSVGGETFEQVYRIVV